MRRSTWENIVVTSEVWPGWAGVKFFVFKSLWDPGVIHTALTPVFYDKFAPDALWFAGTGLALVFLGLLNIMVVTGLAFLGTGISGGLLSSDKPMPVAVLRVHQIVPFLTVLSTGATLYLLLSH